MLVGDWMSREPVTAVPSESILTAKARMGKHSIRRLPVVERGELVGIITESDIREYTPSKASSLDVWEMHFIIDRLTVGELMSRPVLTVTPATPLEEAAALMCERKVHGLPVVEEGALVGVVTETDLFRAFVAVTGGTRSGLRIELGAGKGFRLSTILEALEAAGAVVLSFVTGPERPGRDRGVAVRVIGITPERVRAALKGSGVTVTDLRQTA